MTSAHPPLTALGAIGLLLASTLASAQPCPVAGDTSPHCAYSHALHVEQARSAPGKFAAKMIFLADQLERNIDRKSSASLYLIGSFTHLNNLSETSPLGRLMAESLIHELQVRQWKIFEPRLMQNFLITKDGEFTLSRDVKHLRDSFGITGVVTGTMIASEDNLVINARVIDTQTGLVTSTGQVQIPANWFTDGLASDSRRTTFKVIGGQ